MSHRHKVGDPGSHKGGGSLRRKRRHSLADCERSVWEAGTGRRSQVLPSGPWWSRGSTHCPPGSTGARLPCGPHPALALALAGLGRARGPWPPSLSVLGCHLLARTGITAPESRAAGAEPCPSRGLLAAVAALEARWQGAGRVSANPKFQGPAGLAEVQRENWFRIFVILLPENPWDGPPFYHVPGPSTLSVEDKKVPSMASCLYYCNPPQKCGSDRVTPQLKSFRVALCPSALSGKAPRAAPALSALLPTLDPSQASVASRSFHAVPSPPCLTNSHAFPGLQCGCCLLLSPQARTGVLQGGPQQALCLWVGCACSMQSGACLAYCALHWPAPNAQRARKQWCVWMLAPSVCRPHSQGSLQGHSTWRIMLSACRSSAPLGPAPACALLGGFWAYFPWECS